MLLTYLRTIKSSSVLTSLFYFYQHRFKKNISHRTSSNCKISTCKSLEGQEGILNFSYSLGNCALECSLASTMIYMSKCCEETRCCDLKIFFAPVLMKIDKVWSTFQHCFQSPFESLLFDNISLLMRFKLILYLFYAQKPLKNDEKHQFYTYL